MLGLQFLVAGARLDRVRALRRLSTSARRACSQGTRLGLGLDGARERRLLHLFWEGADRGRAGCGRRARVARGRRPRGQAPVLRWMHGFRHHAEYPDRTRAVFSALAHELDPARRHHAVHPGGPRSCSVPPSRFRSRCVLALRQHHPAAPRRAASQLHRLISILKVRDRDYDGAIASSRSPTGGWWSQITFDSAEQSHGCSAYHCRA